MKSIQYTPEASKDQAEAFAYYDSRAPGLGDAFLQRIDQSLEAIASRPLAYPGVRGNIRRKLVSGFPYGIVYRDDPGVILLLAVTHLRRRPGYWFPRMGTKRK